MDEIIYYSAIKLLRAEIVDSQGETMFVEKYVDISLEEAEKIASDLGGFLEVN